MWLGRWSPAAPDPQLVDVAPGPVPRVLRAPAPAATDGPSEHQSCYHSAVATRANLSVRQPAVTPARHVAARKPLAVRAQSAASAETVRWPLGAVREQPMPVRLARLAEPQEGLAADPVRRAARA